MKIKHATKHNFEARPKIKPKNLAMNYNKSPCGLSVCKTYVLLKACIDLCKTHPEQS